ncbi:hypothetical protein BY996DRAFT_6933565 [Phakopsora pachyrhizi]|nr:hypothetical protein BY996DRAFT_6933565 [Phakopsora pachyrhizi]
MVNYSHQKNRLSHPISGPSLIPQQVLSSASRIPRSRKPIIDPYKAFSAEDLDGFVGSITSKIRSALLAEPVEDRLGDEPRPRDSFLKGLDDDDDDDVFGGKRTGTDNDRLNNRSNSDYQSNRSLEQINLKLTQGEQSIVVDLVDESINLCKQEHPKTIDPHLDSAEDVDEDEGNDQLEVDEEDEGEEGERESQIPNHDSRTEDQGIATGLNHLSTSNRMINHSLLNKPDVSPAPPVYEVDSSISDESDVEDDDDDDESDTDEQGPQIMGGESDDEIDSNSILGGQVSDNDVSEVETQQEVEELDNHNQKYKSFTRSSQSDSDICLSSSGVHTPSENSDYLEQTNEVNVISDCSDLDSHSGTCSDEATALKNPKSPPSTIATDKNIFTEMRPEVIDLHQPRELGTKNKDSSSSTDRPLQVDQLSYEFFSSSQERTLTKTGSFTANGTMIFRPPSETFDDAIDLDGQEDMDIDADQNTNCTHLEKILKTFENVEAPDSGPSIINAKRSPISHQRHQIYQKLEDVEMMNLLNSELVEDDSFKAEQSLVTASLDHMNPALCVPEIDPALNPVDFTMLSEKDEVEVDDNNDLFEGDKDLHLHRMGEENAHLRDGSQVSEIVHSPVLDSESSEGPLTALSKSASDKINKFIRKVEECSQELVDSDHRINVWSAAEEQNQQPVKKVDNFTLLSKETALNTDSFETEKTRTLLCSKDEKPTTSDLEHNKWGNIPDHEIMPPVEEETFMKAVEFTLPSKKTDLTARFTSSRGSAPVTDPFIAESLDSNLGCNFKDPCLIVKFNLPKKSEEISKIVGFDDTVTECDGESVMHTPGSLEQNPEVVQLDQENNAEVFTSSDIKMERLKKNSDDMDSGKEFDHHCIEGKNSTEAEQVLEEPSSGLNKRQHPEGSTSDSKETGEKSSRQRENGSRNANGLSITLRTVASTTAPQASNEEDSIFKQFLKEDVIDDEGPDVTLKQTSFLNEGAPAPAVTFASSPPTEFQNPTSEGDYNLSREEEADSAQRNRLIPLTIEPQTPMASTTQGQRTPSEFSERFMSRGPASFVTWSAPSSVVSSGTSSSPASVAPPPPLPSASMGAPTEAVGLANQMSRRSSVDSSTHAEPPSPSTSTRQRSAPITQEQRAILPTSDLPNPLEPPPLMHHLTIPKCPHSNSPQTSQASSIVAQPPSPSFTIRVSDTGSLDRAHRQQLTTDYTAIQAQAASVFDVSQSTSANRPTSNLPNPENTEKNYEFLVEESSVNDHNSVNSSTIEQNCLSPDVAKPTSRSDGEVSSEVDRSNRVVGITTRSKPRDSHSERSFPKNSPCNSPKGRSQDAGGRILGSLSTPSRSRSGVDLRGSSLIKTATESLSEKCQMLLTDDDGDQTFEGAKRSADLDSESNPPSNPTSPSVASVVKQEDSQFEQPEILDAIKEFLDKEPTATRRKSLRNRRANYDGNYTPRIEESMATYQEELDHEASLKMALHNRKALKKNKCKESAPLKSPNTTSEPMLTSVKNKGRKKSAPLDAQKGLASDAEREPNLASDATEVESVGSGMTRHSRVSKRDQPSTPRTPIAQDSSCSQRNEVRSSLTSSRKSSRLKPALDDMDSEDPPSRRLSFSVVIPSSKVSNTRPRGTNPQESSHMDSPFKGVKCLNEIEKDKIDDSSAVVERSEQGSNSEQNVAPRKRLHQHTSKGSLLPFLESPGAEKKVLESEDNNNQGSYQEVSPLPRTPKRKPVAEVESRIATAAVQVPQSNPPVTRSHCHFVRLTFDRVEEQQQDRTGNEIDTFLVPQCAIGDLGVKVKMKEMGVREESDVSAEEQGRSIKIGQDGRRHLDEKRLEGNEEGEDDILVNEDLMRLLGNVESSTVKDDNNAHRKNDDGSDVVEMGKDTSDVSQENVKKRKFEETDEEGGKADEDDYDEGRKVRKRRLTGEHNKKD